METFHFFLVIAVLLFVVGALVFSQLRPLVIFSFAALVLFSTDVVPLEQFAANYVNPSLLTLVVLLLFSVVLERTTLIIFIAKHILSGSNRSSLFRLSLLSGLTSSLLNNTAVVAALIGPIRKQYPYPAKLLLPLSYASIFGGMLTLIGCSTNLIVSGFIEQAGMEPLGFFDFSWVGLPVFFTCLLVLTFVSFYLLPATGQQAEQTLQPDYFLERVILVGSPLVGRSVAENGLRELQDLFLTEIIRNGRVMTAVSPETILHAEDILVFSGDPSAFEILTQFPGLMPMDNHDDLLRENLVEVVISPSSVLIGRTIKQADFRSRFDAAVVAVQRGDKRLSGGLGGHTLHPGDALVLAAGADFKQRGNLARNFILVGGVDTPAMLSSTISYLVLAGFLAAVGFSVLGLSSFFKSLLLLLACCMAFGAVRIDDLRRRFPFELILVVGGALGLAQAMVSTGVASWLAEGINLFFGGFGVYGAYIGTFIVTWLFTELVTNNAAAALVFPIALATANQWSVNPYPFIMAVAFGASASFISPYGYQTNLMVYTAGGYRLKDYLKAGTPLLITYSFVSLLMIPLIFPF